MTGTPRLATSRWRWAGSKADVGWSRSGDELVLDRWTQPVAHWRGPVDSRARHVELVETGALLSRWEPAPLEPAPTDCFKVGGEYWIWQPGVGGIQFFPDQPEFFAFPAEQGDPAWFEYVVTRSWLPAVYQVWGRQVLHASAVAREDTGEVIVFAGPSHAGKSTLAYGLSRRAGWRHLGDDTLAFSCGDGSLELHPLPNEARLRPATASHFGHAGGTEPLGWPNSYLRMARVYFVRGEESLPSPVTIEPLKVAESYRLLLEQAHAFAMTIPEYNQRLMRDYLELATRVPGSRLVYRKSFDSLDTVFDAIEHPASSR